MKYDVTPVELINLLTESGMYEPPNVEQYLADYEKEHNITISGCLREFMMAAYMHPLLETADIWAQEEGPKWFSLYEEIQEMLDEDREEYLENQESDFHIFAKTPRERWGELVPDYLNIGSDYAAGVVTYGIREKDLGKENPPVYLQHEADPLTQWNMLYESLTDYLLYVICDALLGVFYDTAQDVLEEYGWEFENYEYDTLEDAEDLFKKYDITPSRFCKIREMYPEDWQSERIVCCREGLVIVIKLENYEVEAVVISKESTT